MVTLYLYMCINEVQNFIGSKAMKSIFKTNSYIEYTIYMYIYSI